MTPSLSQLISFPVPVPVSDTLTLSLTLYFFYYIIELLSSHFCPKSNPRYRKFRLLFSILLLLITINATTILTFINQRISSFLLELIDIMEIIKETNRIITTTALFCLLVAAWPRRATASYANRSPPEEKSNYQEEGG